MLFTEHLKGIAPKRKVIGNCDRRCTAGTVLGDASIGQNLVAAARDHGGNVFAGPGFRACIAYRHSGARLGFTAVGRRKACGETAAAAVLERQLPFICQIRSGRAHSANGRGAARGSGGKEDRAQLQMKRRAHCPNIICPRAVAVYPAVSHYIGRHVYGRTAGAQPPCTRLTGAVCAAEAFCGVGGICRDTAAVTWKVAGITGFRDRQAVYPVCSAAAAGRFIG